MGGDHKCPVCQATFTRPQHVARHMRSHTGDRPYKCQFCGDQFARSDLLSRHVNKCHANEKPLANPSTRRKGSASASRATTSKQACDQCVQNSLPCDGSNPCAKCVQRKLRCTYVKFHRQTAPVGPGHKPAGLVQQSGSVTATSSLGPPPTSSSSSRYPIYSEEFLLSSSAGPNPSGASSSGVYGSQHPAQAAIHEALYPQSATAPTFPYGSMYPASTSPADADYTTSSGKYSATTSGAQDDLYRSSSLPPRSNTSSWASSNGSLGANGWPQQDTYPHHQQHPQVERHAYAHQPHSLAPHQQHDGATATSGLPVYLRGSGTATAANEILPPGAGAPTNFREIFSEDFAPHGSLLGSSDRRRGSISDGYPTDSGSESGYYSPVVSARGRRERGGNYHLDGMDQASPFSFDPHHGRSGSSSSSSRHHRSGRPSTAGSVGGYPHPPGTASSTTSSTGGGSNPPGSSGGPGSGTFFNAFGSMTLDDQNMLAGLAAAAAGGAAAPQKADGSPFFAHMNLEHGGAVPFPSSSSGTKRTASQGGDNAADPDATPMPIKEEESGGDGERALRMGEGPRIHRPLSSLAALPLSSVQDLNWSSYLGLGTPSGGLGPGYAGTPGGSGMGGINGWTPGGNNVAAYAASLAGLGEHNNSQFGAMPTGMTPGKEMDPKELREFWKQYLRTPLTGPETVTAEDSEKVLGADNSNAGVSTPHPHRRPRVTSMPSSNKTPVAGDRDRLYAAGLGPNDSSYHHHPRHHYQQPSIGPTSSLRTTLHPRDEVVRKEDLSSYEAAVLARKTPMNLSMNRLSTRRKGGGSANIAGVSQLSKMSSAGGNMTTAIGRDRSMSEVSNASSTAGNPYGGPEQRPSSNAAREFMMLHYHSPHHRNAGGAGGAGSDESTSGSGGESPASRASSLGVDVTMDSMSRPTSSAGLDAAFGRGVGMQHLQRPTVKRLASSVLESDNPKAMKFDSAMSPEGSGSGDVSMVSPPPIAVQPPPLGTLASLPPLSTQGLDGGKSKNAMMAPPNSAPPQASQNSLLSLNLPTRSGSGVTLAERRRLATANMVSRGDFEPKSRRMSDAS